MRPRRRARARDLQTPGKDGDSQKDSSEEPVVGRRGKRRPTIRLICLAQGVFDDHAQPARPQRRAVPTESGHDRDDRVDARHGHHAGDRRQGRRRGDARGGRRGGPRLPRRGAGRGVQAPPRRSPARRAPIHRDPPRLSAVERAREPLGCRAAQADARQIRCKRHLQRERCISVVCAAHPARIEGFLARSR